MSSDVGPPETTADPSALTDQQRAILAAALDLLASGGPAALRVRDIAEAAGCTTMAVYSRFGGKDGLLDAIFVDGFQRFAASLRRSLGRGGDNPLLRLGYAYRRWALENPGPYQVMFTEAVPGFRPSERGVRVAQRSFDVLVDAVRADQQAGKLGGGDATRIAWGLWGISHGLVMLELAGVSPTGTDSDPEQIYAASLAAMCAGFSSDT